MFTRPRVFLWAFALAVNGAIAERPFCAMTDPDEIRLSSSKALCIPVEGCITASFAKVHAVLRSSNLLERVQQVYADQLPEGAKPEFVVHSAGDGRYYYVNNDDERCDIRELWRDTDTNTSFRCAFYVTGERFFGRFESLITLSVMRSSSDSTETMRYVTDVRVCPHSATVRVFLRHMPGVDFYFRRKTAEMRRIISAVFTRLAGPETG